MTDTIAPIYNGAYLLRPRQPPFAPIPIVEEFQAVNLKTLIDYEADVYPWSVREFYHNFHFTRGINTYENNSTSKWVSFFMRGRSFSLTMREFNYFMDLPIEEGIRFYTNSLKFKRDNIVQAYVERDDLLETICDSRYIEECKQTKRVEVTQLKEEVKMAYRVIRQNVTCRDMEVQMPGQPDADSVMVIEALVIYWIKNEVPFDMGFIMASIMQDTEESHALRPKPYGMRLTSLFRPLGFDNGQKYSVRRLPLI